MTTRDQIDAMLEAATVVPAARLRAMITLLGAEEMTPTATRMLMGLVDEAVVADHVPEITDRILAENMCSDLLEEVEALDGWMETEEQRDDAHELTWQGLICAYLAHPGWQQVAEALFAKAGYTPEQIREFNAPFDKEES